MAGRYPINLNLAFNNCQYNPFTIGIAIDNPALTQLCLRSGQPDPHCFYPIIREAPAKPKEYDIRFDDNLLAYLINIFIGNENQMVSVIIDTNMTDILFPTNCCVGSEANACLQNYGIYFFDQSSSCLVEKPNRAITNCYNFDCYTLQYTEKVRNREEIFPYGVLKKAVVYDFVSFDQDAAIKRIKNPKQDKKNKQNQKNNNRLGDRIPLIIILEIIVLYAPYIPPTLGLAPGNTIGKKNFTIDFKNNKIKFELDPNPKYLLNNLYNVQDSYTAKVAMIGVGNFRIPIKKVPAIFDTGNSNILLPPNIYQKIRELIISKSNIGPDSKLWRGEIVQLNRIERLIAPDILISFETKNNAGDKTWTCIIKKENYLKEVQRNRYLLLLGVNNDNFINFGNCGMKNYKFGFSQSGNIFVY